MYLNYYHLKREPFHITPDPDFLFLSESHKQALASILYGTEAKKGFIVITGAVGVGKTTVIRSYLARVSKENTKIVYIFNANVSFGGLVNTICHDLGLQPIDTDIFETVNQLHHTLIDQYRSGKNVVLIVDEAQNMPVETLENLRMLSNLETNKEKLIQIILVGQPEFEQLLDKPELRQLKQRVAVNARIVPLTAEESNAYVLHRLSLAGSGGQNPFSKKALQILVQESAGIPRKLNILCDNALINGFGYEQNPVSPKVAREVISEMNSEGKARLRWWRLLVPSLLACAVVAYLLFFTNLLQFVREVKAFRAGGGFVVADLGDRAPQEPSANPDVNAQEPPPPTVAPQEKRDVDPEKKVPEKMKNPDSTVRARTVQRGDNLSKLATEMYGTMDDRIIKLIQGKNPDIKNANVIMVGSKIYFPELPEKGRN